MTRRIPGRVAGGFAEAVRVALARDPALVAEIARRILNAHFPESIRQDVADAVGLSLETESAATPEQSQRRRDPAFREKVLLAYEYRCCVCGHDLRMGGHAIGGSRAHQVVPGARAGRGAERPCALLAAPQDLRPRRVHLLPGNHQIVFSRHLMGGDDTKAKLLAHHGAGLIQPQGSECLPNPEFLAWHRAEAFKEPARE
jgi:putative restriction endonuclease